MKVYFVYIFLLLFNFISNEGDIDYSIQMEAEKCALSPPKTCRDVELTGDHLCCEVFETNADNIQESCEMKTTKEAQMQIVGSSKIINKELAGLDLYNDKYGGAYGDNIDDRKFEIQRTISITCATWSFSIDIVDGEYSEEEINILKSENHCLSYFNPYFKHTLSNRREVTRDICYKALLLPSTKLSGISCGYLEIDIKEGNSKEEKRTTCFLYDPKVARSKTLDESTRLNLNAMTKKNENDNINYNFTIYGPNGKEYSYSSITRKVEVVGEEAVEDTVAMVPSNYDSNNNYGIINKLSSCFVILIILSLL